MCTRKIFFDLICPYVIGITYFLKTFVKLMPESDAMKIWP